MAWETGKVLGKGYLSHQTREDEHSRQWVKAQKWERVGLVKGGPEFSMPAHRCCGGPGDKTAGAGGGGAGVGCLLLGCGDGSLSSRNREMSELCKWNKA